MDATRRSLPKAARIAAWTALVVFAVYAVGLGLILPPLVRKAGAERIGAALGRPVTIERVRVNPFTLRASVEGLKVFEPDGRSVFAAFDALDAQASLASLAHLAPVIDSAILRGLRVHVVRDGEAHYNLSDALERLLGAASPQPVAPSQGAAFSVSNVQVVGGRVDFDDLPTKKRHEVSEIDVSIPFLSSLPVHAKELVKPRFSARVNGSVVRLEGETLPFESSLATHLVLNAKDVDLARYAAYAPVPLPLAIDSGLLDARVIVRFEYAGKTPAFEISGTAALRDLAGSTKDGEPWIRAGHIEAEVAQFRPLAATMAIAAVRVRDLDAVAQHVRIASTEARGIDADLRQRTLRAQAITVDGGDARLERMPDGSMRIATLRFDEPAAPPTPWQVTVDRFVVSGFAVALADHAAHPAVEHRGRIVRLEAEGLGGEHGGSGRAVAKVALERGGEASIEATFALEPLAVEAKLDARNVDLVPLRPYVAQFPTVALRQGRASARGTLRIHGSGDAMRIAYTGAAGVADLATFETASREDLLNWKAVAAKDVRFAWGPRSRLDLAIGDVLVDRAYSRLIVHPDGKLNVQALRGAGAATTKTAADDTAAPNLRIDRIALVASRLNFTDLFVKPNYSADVGELEGTITGLSSDPATRGTMDLHGSYDRTSPVVIAGTINPLAPQLFVDVTAKGSDIELPRLTAYSQRYAGYGITAGKLTLDVRYHIENGKLEGRNKILLESLTFGAKVESPDAIKVPILFAVNLLKDKDGRIDLELPVSGSLDDPQFEMSGLIGQVVSNLLKKVISHPFEFLSAVFSGGAGDGDASAGADAAKASARGDDLAYVDFDPGRADLDPKGRGKLDRLARVLGERPGLKLEVASRIDESRELRALKFAQLRHEVAEAKRRALGVQGEVTVDDAEYPKYLRAAYAAAKLPADDLSVATMETRLLERFTVDAEILHKLAADRAERVRSYLTAEGLPAERVVMAPPGEDAPQGEATSRVVFSLQ